MIVAMGIERADVYIANIVKCRPPRNRDPEGDEVEACEPFLQRQIRAVQPEVIVALGRYASQTLARQSTAISRMRGKWLEYEGIALLPTFHPAYLLRNPAEKKPVWLDLQQVMGRLGLEPPARR
jgi:DNA polymerase